MTRWCSLLLVLLALPLQAFQPVPPPGRTVGAPAREPVDSYEFEIASDGDGFFLATSDHRYGDYDLLGYRYDAAGEPLDLDAFPVAATWRSDTVHARPIWNGAEYVVFAASEHIGTWRQRVSRDATVHSAGEPLPSYVGGAAWNGARYAAIAFASSGVRLQFFDGTLQPAGEVVIDTPNDWSAAAIATGGSQFLAVWGNGGSLLAQVFDERGTATSARLTLATMPTGGSGLGLFYSAIAWNGSSYAVAWSDSDSVDVAFLTSAGAEISRTSIPAIANHDSLDIAWDGVTYLVTWARSPTDDVHAALLSPSGAVLETIPLPAVSSRTSVASNGRFFFVATSRARFIVRSTGSPRVSEPKPLTIAFANQTGPRITASASMLFTAWSEAGAAFASRLNARGEPLDGRGLRLGSGGVTDVATAGETHLVLFSDRFARVTSAGEILDPEGSVAVDGGRIVASNGTSFLVAGLSNFSYMTLVADVALTMVPMRGPAQPRVTIARSVWIDTRLHALLPFSNGYALVWTRYLDSPCFPSARPCTRRTETTVTLTADDGTPIRSSIIAAYGSLASVSTDGTALLMSFLGGAERPGISTMRVGADLTQGPQIVVYSGDVKGGFLTRAGDGYTLTFSTPVPDWQETQENLLRLDASGHPIGIPQIVGARTPISDLVHAFGATWVTVVRRWSPLPESHEGIVERAYVEDIRTRRRAVAH